MHGAAGFFGGEAGEKLGVAGLGEAGPVEHVLRDRIGDDSGGDTCTDIGDGAADGR